MSLSPIEPTRYPFHIKTGDHDVVANGTVIASDSQKLEFHLAHLKVVLSFVNDTAEPGRPRLGPGVATGSTLTLTLFNFSNPLGSGTNSPLEIGHLAGRKLWLSFMVYAMTPESSKTVHYTFSVGGAV